MQRLRAPFVITALLGVGCSDDALGVPSADVGSNETSTTDANADGAPLDASPCPTSDPGFGPARAPCSAEPSVRCSYADECPDSPEKEPKNVYACMDDGVGLRWTRVSIDYTPKCPTVSPRAGDPCPCAPHLGYMACNFGLCEDDTRTYAACRGIDTFDRVWTVQGFLCNPPEPDAGDAGDVSDARDASDASDVSDAETP